MCEAGNMLVQSPRPVPSFAPDANSEGSQGAVMNKLRQRKARRSEHSSSDHCSFDSGVAAAQDQEASTSQRHNPPREVASLPKPSEQVMQLLNSRQAGQQLLMQIRGSRDPDLGGSSTESELRLECCLREIHASLLEVDEDLMDSNLSESVDQEAVTSCRSWLQKLQSFMLSLQRSLTAEFPSRTSGGRPGQGEQQPKARCGPEWQAFLHAISAEFGHVLEAMDDFSQQSSSQQPDVVDTPAQQKDQDLARSTSRLVCLRSRLEYRTFWAGKVGV